MTLDAVVVGTGVMGAATGWALASRGRSVMMLDRYEIGHARGSSHGRSRIFRYSYPDTRYVEMATMALPLWRQLEDECGRTLLEVTGGLDMGPGIEDHAVAMGACGVPFELLKPAEARARWDFLRPDDGSPVLFHPGAAIVRATDAWAAFADRAVAGGASFRGGERVIAIEPGEPCVVRTEARSHEAAAVVVTAGPWAADLLEPVGIEVPVTTTRETVAYFDVPQESLPTLVHWGQPAVYALPSPGQGYKVAEHIAGPQAHPDDGGRPDKGSLERVSDWVRRYLPYADPDHRLAQTCFYTTTADGHFILEAHGEVIVGSPCSGHGFKFAPLIGRMLADLVDQRLG